MDRNESNPSEVASDLDVGDVVWSARAWSSCEVEVESATVMQESKVRVVLSQTGLAFDCRTHFVREDLGRRFYRSRAEALRAFATREEIKIGDNRRRIQRSEDLIRAALAMIDGGAK